MRPDCRLHSVGARIVGIGCDALDAASPGGSLPSEPSAELVPLDQHPMSGRDRLVGEVEYLDWVQVRNRQEKELTALEQYSVDVTQAGKDGHASGWVDPGPGSRLGGYRRN